MLCLVTSTRAQAFGATAFVINPHINGYLMQVYLEGQETIDWLDTPQLPIIKGSFNTDGDESVLPLNQSDEWFYSQTFEAPTAGFPLLLTFGVVFIGRRSLVAQ
jgi:hypothetical protein